MNDLVNLLEADKSCQATHPSIMIGEYAGKPCIDVYRGIDCWDSQGKKITIPEMMLIHKFSFDGKLMFMQLNEEG